MSSYLSITGFLFLSHPEFQTDRTISGRDCYYKGRASMCQTSQPSTPPLFPHTSRSSSTYASASVLCNTKLPAPMGAGPPAKSIFHAVPFCPHCRYASSAMMGRTFPSFVQFMHVVQGHGLYGRVYISRASARGTAEQERNIRDLLLYIYTYIIIYCDCCAPNNNNAYTPTSLNSSKPRLILDETRNQKYLQNYIKENKSTENN